VSFAWAVPAFSAGAVFCAGAPSALAQATLTPSSKIKQTRDPSHLPGTAPVGIRFIVTVRFMEDFTLNTLAALLIIRIPCVWLLHPVTLHREGRINNSFVGKASSKRLHVRSITSCAESYVLFRLRTVIFVTCREGAIPIPLQKQTNPNPNASPQAIQIL
jgi:hypothetical protein